MAVVHWIGAGLSAVPGIRRLAASGRSLVLWNRTLDKATRALQGLNATAAARELDWGELERTVQPRDVIVSMLPATMHMRVADLCLNRHAHFVSSSYLSAEMRALASQVAAADLCFVNEVGLDPGIDHLFAHVLVGHYKSSMAFDPQNEHFFRSYCGGFPKVANKFRYKFSWSPLGVLRALKSPAQWLERGEVATTEKPWTRVRDYQVRLPEGSELFQAYPNRNSLPFMSEYGFQADWRISEFIRGTLRLKGWAEAWREIFALVEQAEGDAGVRLLESKSEELWRAYQYQPGELDRVVLSVDLEVKRDGETVWHQVHCLDETGNEHGTAMARLVSLTCSLAVDSVLQGKLRAGVMGAPNEMVLIDDWLGKLSQMGEKMQRIELV